MKKSPARNTHFKKKPSKLLEKINSSIETDQRLYKEDIEGSIAHTNMLMKTKIISSGDGRKIINALKDILDNIECGKTKFESSYEDIHMNIEALLKKKIGSIAGKLHTARSRNDQVVTDFKLWIKKNIININEECKNFQKALINVAKKNTDSVMPGYTHLQTAQPVSLAHHCLAYVEMIGRDRSRLKDTLNRLNQNPLGAGALSGTSFPIDRNITTKLLGFKEPTMNSIDSVSDRDFVVEFLFNLSLISVHLSRLAEEIVLWASQQFNFIRLPDELSTGSSIMPQKKNPDGAELVRAQASHTISNLNTLLILLKGLPLTYSKDLQDDKKLTFHSLDTVSLGLQVMTELINKTFFNINNMKKAVNSSHATATDLADWLVKKLDYTFREAYQVTGKIVAFADKKKITLGQLTLDELKNYDRKITKDIFLVLSAENSMKSKKSFGGTSPEIVKKSIQYAIKKYL
ncbi:argininosuccinate lyase [Alphaproteobacteria bacterium]|nr:argininosuccinate lyase [Alphaproteobacteria bacterium]